MSCPTDSLTAQVCRLYSPVAGQFGRGTGERDAAGFEDIGPVRDFQGEVGILFNQQDGEPRLVQINDPFKGNYDGVTSNGPLGYNKVFPYESTPENGRNIIGLAK